MQFLQKSKKQLGFILVRCIIFTLIFLLIILPKLGFPLYQDKKLVDLYNRPEVAQNNSNLINLIKSDYLIPPAPLTAKLNFTRKAWTSPVTKFVKQLLKNQTGGFFVECGAFDGEWLSNSIELETYFKWEGLLVEADPTYQARIRTKNRKAWIAPVCLSPEPYPMKLTMQRHKNWPAMSNIPTLFYGKTKPGEFPVQFNVQCFPLYSILLALNRTEIDYLSLDVEGAEWSIIQTIPFDKVKIKVISLERTRDFSKSSRYLKSIGYSVFAHVNEPYVLDAVFVHTLSI